MSVIATAVKHLMAAGVTGDALLAAIADMEADLVPRGKVRSAGAIRQERYRERHKASQNVTNVTNNACDISPSLSPAPLSSPQTPQQTPHPHTHPDTTPARKGHRLPADWLPKPLPSELAGSVGVWPVGAIERELARFRDWAASAPGKSGTKSDWDAAWRNWLRRRIDEGTPGNGRQQLQPANGFAGVRGNRPNPALDMVLDAERELASQAFREDQGFDWPPRAALPPH